MPPDPRGVVTVLEGHRDWEAAARHTVQVLGAWVTEVAPLM